MGIIWIASYPRSGNTWLRSFIANVKSEQVPVSHGEFGRYVPHEAAALWYAQFDGIQDEPAGPSRENIERRRVVQQQLAASDPGRATHLKTHNALVSIEGLPLIRDELTIQAVYLTRDPRDVAVSLSLTLGWDIDKTIDFMGQKTSWIGGRGKMGDGPMFEFLGNWSDHVRSWSKAASTIVRYEDLFVREDVFEIIHAACFLRETRAKEAAAIEASRFEALRAREQAYFKERGLESAAPVFRSGKAGVWKEVLTSGQASRIEFNHRDVMRRLNYI